MMEVEETVEVWLSLSPDETEWVSSGFLIKDSKVLRSGLFRSVNGFRTLCIFLETGIVDR
jgi:hypothetical protein